MRQFVFMFVLTMTLALTAAAYFIPETYQSQNQSTTQPTKAIQFHPLAVADHTKITVGQVQQFIPLQTQVEHTTEPVEQLTEDAEQKAESIEPESVTAELQYIGQMVDSNHIKKVFLSKNEHTFVVQVGDIVEQRWKVNVIEDHQVIIFDIENQQPLVLSI